ncbi:rhomboid family intramembrane serine protease [Ornithinimicrobium flavum]|uniref:rhomboid family intramembrane serine protease n=1 Tax=Ornithinimicrobium flavum TaxID=1288636 RepID=UPI0010701D89|nr:rhomboid family intramembrane serine protease [Ornithinimicrobium flavum]
MSITQQPAGRPAPRPDAPAWLHRVIPVLLLVALMWVSEVVDLVMPLDLDRFGIRPRDTSHLAGIVLSPFLHLGFGHLLANTVSLLALGSLLALSTRHLWLVTGGVILLGGLGVWLLGGPGTVHIGASGVVYGYAAFLAVYGFVARRFGSALVGVLVVVLYGSMLWGVLPLRAGVSWQAHLFGALAGVALAVWLGRQDRAERAGRVGVRRR